MPLSSLPLLQDWVYASPKLNKAGDVVYVGCVPPHAARAECQDEPGEAHPTGKSLPHDGAVSCPGTLHVPWLTSGPPAPTSPPAE